MKKRLSRETKVVTKRGERRQEFVFGENAGALGFALNGCHNYLQTMLFVTYVLYGQAF